MKKNPPPPPPNNSSNETVVFCMWRNEQFLKSQCHVQYLGTYFMEKKLLILIANVLRLLALLSS